MVGDMVLMITQALQPSRMMWRMLNPEIFVGVVNWVNIIMEKKESNWSLLEGRLFGLQGTSRKHYDVTVVVTKK